MSILRHDVKLLCRDKLAVISLAAFMLCVSASLLLGHFWAERYREIVAAHVFDERREVLQDRIAPTEVKRKIVMNVAPLLNLTVGRSDLEPSFAVTSFWAREDRLFVEEQLDGPIALAAGRFDLAFVSVWLAPLLLISLGLSIVGVERDSGLLRMQATASTTLGRRALTRALLRWAIVLSVIALAAILGAALAPAAPAKTTALLLWVSAVGSYLLFWQASILLASSFRIRQEVLGLVLFALWAVFLVVIPAFGSATAQTLNPPPSRFALIAEARATEVNERDNIPDGLRSLMHDHPNFVIGSEVEDYVKANAVISGRIEDAVRPTIVKFDAAHSAQRQVAEWFELLSPALLTHRLLADAAGSGEAAHSAFRLAAIDYHRKVRETLLAAGLRGNYLMADDIQRIPRFTAPEALRPSGGPLCLILMLAGVATGLCLIAIRRLSRQNAVL